MYTSCSSLWVPVDEVECIEDEAVVRAQVPIKDLPQGEPQDLRLELGRPESREVRNPLDVGVQARSCYSRNTP